MTATVSAALTAEEADVQRRVDELLAANPPGRTDRQAFLKAQFDAGLAWVHFPQGSGGLGLSPKLQRIVDTVLAKAGAPAPDVNRNIIGHGMAAPDHRRPRHAGAAGPLPPAAVHRRGDLVPAVLRAGRRVRPGRAGHPGHSGRRRVARQRPEGVDDPGPHLPLRAPGGPHRSRPPQAPRPDLLHLRHGGRRRRRAPPAPAHRRRRVQRGVPERRPPVRRPPPRRGGRRLAGVDDDADERAGGDRRWTVQAGERRNRPGRRRVEVDRVRRPRPARPAHEALGGSRGQSAHEPAGGPDARGWARRAPKGRWRSSRSPS